MNPSFRSGLKTKKSTHSARKTADRLGRLPKGEEVIETLLARSEVILQKLSSLEELLKRKNDKPLTFKDACAYLGYAPSYLYKLTYRNVIPHYKPTGKMIFFSKNELDEWIFRGSDKCRVMSDELKNEKITEKDPNQVEMFGTSTSLSGQVEKKVEVKNEKDVIIEFPLKSRRRKEL